ncbi:bifunctional riboflavin kinase/FAD synthetase [Zophobihabitans entericus]|uniref:Riboflavin biosynthesis protein n=1 Tax=Zophobihabitans entericus TaxID=1635327 RepID=A0A6G9IDA8_9GAMM|nr:bifunctional riboflavin kinase/FAD synthetase [Zophobihabitans entericus]QIQ22216.1 bifunctional riboflavin kinase/FAD synthetase [Zophobihabitans entericus]
MKIIRGIYNLKHQFSRCALTMGNFDGIHLGHQSLITRLKQIAKELDLPTVVMIFEPQPLEFFLAEKAPARLTSFQEKYAYFKELGVDYLLCVPFNHTMADLPAEAFVEQWLIKQLQAQYIIIGDDFKFGKARAGSFELLANYAQQGCFQVENLPSFFVDGVRVSSSAVREALANDDFQLATRLLGRPYAIEGKVVHGNALARQLGFPTANIHLHRKNAALQGVYFVTVSDVEKHHHYHGIANIGQRPTINGKTTVLEVNLFDFSNDIYGHHLNVVFHEKLRNEKKFASLNELKQQIAQDVCIARQISAKF